MIFLTKGQFTSYFYLLLFLSASVSWVFSLGEFKEVLALLRMCNVNAFKHLPSAPRAENEHPLLAKIDKLIERYIYLPGSPNPRHVLGLLTEQKHNTLQSSMKRTQCDTFGISLARYRLKSDQRMYFDSQRPDGHCVRLNAKSDFSKKYLCHLNILIKAD